MDPAEIAEQQQARQTEQAISRALEKALQTKAADQQAKNEGAPSDTSGK